ncbi:MAG: type III pantothenate kinase [Bacteroidales bacterium]|nr:type III pantothenate kinase [Bacteroidales bacterium]
MYNILIDIGNTACKVAVSENGRMTAVGRTSEETDVPAIVNNIVTDKRLAPQSIIISTVRNRNRKFEKALKTAYGKENVLNFDLDFVRKTLSSDLSRAHFPLMNVLENMPDGMGADRMAAILAAHIRCPEGKIMIFDFGTATTVEFINKDWYEGGSISLGLNTRYRALSVFTKKIPLLNPNTFLAFNDIKNISTIGFDLDTALAAGNILGIIFEIEGYIGYHPDREIFFTGGDSDQLAKRISKPVNVVPDLVLEGLDYIATQWQKRCK